MRKDSYFRLIDSTSISCIDPEGSFSWIRANYRESLRERLRLQFTSKPGVLLRRGKFSWLTDLCLRHEFEIILVEGASRITDFREFPSIPGSSLLFDT